MLKKLGIGQDIIGNGGDTDNGDMDLGATGGDNANVAQDKLTAKQDQVAAKKADLQGIFGKDGADAGDDT